MNLTEPVGSFITQDDSIYVAVRGSSRVWMWLNGSATLARTFNASSSAPSDVFVTSNGDTYVDNGASQRRVDRWALNATNPTTVMYVSGSCFGLFVDIDGSLYCSTEAPHQVLKRWLNGPLNSTVLVAGNGTNGSTSNLLNCPRGIFVDTNLQLYVADSSNNRVLRFPSGQLNAVVVAGSGATGTIVLSVPTDVILDANGYLFIVEFANHRVIGSGPNGFRCVVGCTGTSSGASNQLRYPHSLSFDSRGNLYVTDVDNKRVQKFLLATNSCGEFV